MSGKSDNSGNIAKLEDRIAWHSKFSYAGGTKDTIIACRAAIELLKAHDDTGIVLDHWGPVREFVENTLGNEIVIAYPDE